MFRKKQKLSSGATSLPEIKRTSREASSWFLLGALACAIAAGLAVTSFLRAAVPSESVYLLKKDLQPGAVITSGDLEEVKVPAAAAPPDRVKSPRDAEGKHARSFLAKGDTLREAHLVETLGSPVAAALALENNAGLRAVALPPEASEGLPVSPGDRVDVYAYFVAQGAPAGQSVLLAPAARVLSVPAGDETGSGDSKSITVAVPQEAAARIAAALGMNGKLLAAVVPPGTP